METSNDGSLAAFTEVCLWWLCWKAGSFKSPVMHACSHQFLAIGLRVTYNTNSTASAPSFIKEHKTGYKGHLCYPKDWLCLFGKASQPEPRVLPRALALSSLQDRQLSVDNILLVPFPLPCGLFGELSFQLLQWQPLSDIFIPYDVETV